jgi:hypothetical protein
MPGCELTWCTGNDMEINAGVYYYRREFTETGFENETETSGELGMRGYRPSLEYELRLEGGTF